MAQVPNKIQSGGNAAERARESRGSRSLTPPSPESDARARAIQKRVDYKQSGKGDFVVPEQNNAYVRAIQKTLENKQRRMSGG